MTFSTDDACLKAFFELACDASHDKHTHPNTVFLQDFIKNQILPKAPKEECIQHFMAFAAKVASHSPNMDDATRKRSDHAIRKVTIDLGLIKPQY